LDIQQAQNPLFDLIKLSINLAWILASARMTIFLQGAWLLRKSAVAQTAQHAVRNLYARMMSMQYSVDFISL
jgi:hypothetical protein